MTGENMKATKVTLIIQTVLMYVMHLPLYIALILLFLDSKDDSINQMIMPLILTSLILACVVFPICIINVVFSIISLFKGEYNPSKVTMIVKLALIPWFALNFVFCAVVIMGMLNPWLLIAIPFVIIITASFTYLYMVTTSLPDVAFFIRGVIRKEIKPCALTIVSIVFMFVFCFDIIGALTFYLKVRNIKTLS